MCIPNEDEQSSMAYKFNPTFQRASLSFWNIIEGRPRDTEGKVIKAFFQEKMGEMKWYILASSQINLEFLTL